MRKAAKKDVRTKKAREKMLMKLSPAYNRTFKRIFRRMAKQGEEKNMKQSCQFHLDIKATDCFCEYFIQ